MVHEINWHVLFHEMCCGPCLAACGLTISIPFGYFNGVSGHVIPSKVPKAPAACHSEKSELARASLPAHFTTQLPRIGASQPIGLGHGLLLFPPAHVYSVENHINPQSIL